MSAGKEGSLELKGHLMPGCKSASKRKEENGKPPHVDQVCRIFHGRTNLSGFGSMKAENNVKVNVNGLKCHLGPV